LFSSKGGGGVCREIDSGSWLTESSSQKHTPNRREKKKKKEVASEKGRLEIGGAHSTFASGFSKSACKGWTGGGRRMIMVRNVMLRKRGGPILVRRLERARILKGGGHLMTLKFNFGEGESCQGNLSSQPGNSNGLPHASVHRYKRGATSRHLAPKERN